MDGKILLILLGIAAAGSAFLIAKLVSFFRVFTDDARYICYKMDHADCYEEYRRWRGELRCHYLTLIPFVNDKNVMSVYRFIFHRGESSDKGERKDGIWALLMPSVLGICCCLFCVCGMTWAWFSASVQSAPQKMTAAYYDVTVEFVKNGNDSVDAIDGGYALTAGTTYTVKLTASGTVKECGGYCLIENEDGSDRYYTTTFDPGKSIIIPLTPKTGGTYTFKGVWGSISSDVPKKSIITGVDANNALMLLDTPDTTATPDTTNSENSTPDTPVDVTEAPLPAPDPVTGTDTEPVPTPAPAPADTSAETEAIATYTVQKKDTLSAIALKYGVTVEALKEYNDINDPNFIVTGQSIKIPPADWKAPVGDTQQQ